MVGRSLEEPVLSRKAVGSLGLEEGQWRLALIGKDRSAAASKSACSEGQQIERDLMKVDSTVDGCLLGRCSMRLPLRVRCSTEPCQVSGLEPRMGPGWLLRCRS